MVLLDIVMPTQKADVWISYVAEIIKLCFNLLCIVVIYRVNCTHPNR